MDKKVVEYSGDLELESKEIMNLEEKSDEEVRASFSSLCGGFYTILCCG